MRGRTVVVMLGLAAGACRGPEAPRDPTAAMVDTLRAIAARSQAHPDRNPFLNRARADRIAARLRTRGGPFDAEGYYYLAQERLAAGQTREAIAAAERILAEVGIGPTEVTARTKPLFDLLGIAWLRLGEQENCLADPGATVCILPLEGAARHEKEEGARRAIATYRAILDSFPDDHGSRWLLNIAALAVGEYPAGVPERWRVPGLVPADRARFAAWTNIAPVVGLAVDGLSGGLSVDDFDGDGHLDLFMTSWGLADQVRLFRADGGGGYVERTAEAGLAGITGGLNTVHADYDNDGDVDLLVLRGAWLADDGGHPNSLLRNRGDGTFEDVTIPAGLLSFHPTPTAAWADYDLDGDLDLFIGNESGAAEGRASHRSQLYRNEGDGTFTEVSAAAGIDLDAFVKGVAWGDVDDDGLPDLYASVLFGPNRLYRNLGARGDGWAFEEVAARAGVERPRASFGTWFFDVDQDGWDDLLVLSYDIEDSGALHDAVAREFLRARPAGREGTAWGTESSRLYLNNRDGTFRDATAAYGLADKVIFAMGANFGDLDNDGWLDLHLGTGNPDLRSIIPNRMFRNVAGRRFEEVTLPGGFGHIQKGHGTAFVDLDRDGDSDVYMVMGGAYEGDRFANVLYENPGWPRRAWVVLELEGRTANRGAVGARVEVTVRRRDGGARTLHRTIGTGGSFGAGSHRLTLGLGEAVAIERVIVRWPDAARSVTDHPGLTPGTTYRIVQGDPAREVVRPAVPFRKAATPAHVGH